MDPAMTIFRERLPGSSLFEGPIPVSVSSLAPSFVPRASFLPPLLPSFLLVFSFTTSPFLRAKAPTRCVFDYREGTRRRDGRGRTRQHTTFQVLLGFYWTVVVPRVNFSADLLNEPLQPRAMFSQKLMSGPEPEPQAKGFVLPV